MRPHFAILLPCLAAAMPAQEPAPTFGHSRHGAEFDDGPRQAARRIAGTGNVHFPITCATAEAQAFFDQGIGQLHGFWYYEAERSFRHVAALEPDCAIAYSMLALANFANPRRAAGFAAQGMLRRERAGARERLWIDAIARCHEIGDDDLAALRGGDAAATKRAREALEARAAKRDGKRLDRAFVRDLEGIVAAHPGDIEAKAFLVNQIWLNWRDHGIEYNSHAAVDALLDAVFAASPLHPAHHYRIHLWDKERPERALRSAAQIGESAPAIAHQWHMAAHVYDKLQRPADAAWQQMAAACADHAQMLRDRVPPYEIHNYGHNQEWLVRSLAQLGRVQDALAVARDMLAQPRHPKRNALATADSIADYGHRRLIGVLTDHELWDEAVALAEAGVLEPGETPAQRARRAALLVRAHAASGSVAAAETGLAELDDAIQAARAARGERIDRAESEAQGRGDAEIRQAMEQALDAGTDDLRRVEALRAPAAAALARARGDAASALAQIDAADGAPAALRTELLLATGDASKAAEVARDEQQRHPASVAELARLVHALHAAGSREAFVERFGELRRVAGTADLDAPLLRRLAPLAAEFGWPADWRQAEPARDDVGWRPPLGSIGPLRWQPAEAPEFTLPALAGGELASASLRGRPVLLVCYLGFGCLHCVEQLEDLAPRQADLAALGVQVVAIGTDALPAARDAFAALDEAERPRFPLLADPELRVFRAFRAYDDFERMPLHGTFLLDAGGRIRWQDVGPEPFRDVAFLIAECRRLLRLEPAVADAGIK